MTADVTAIDNYAGVEQLIESAHWVQSNNGPGCGSEEVLAEAQVRATLAVADSLARLVDVLSRVGEHLEESIGHAKVTADALDKIARYAGTASW